MTHAQHESTLPGVLTRLVGVARGRVGHGGRPVERRRHPRAPAEVAGTFGGDAVWVVDLTTAGAGLVAPRAVDQGARVDLAVELPMMDGHLETTNLRLTVTACRPDLESDGAYRVGGTVVPQTDLDRIALVEYCHLVASWQRLAAGGHAWRGDRRRAVREPVLATSDRL